jgi:adenosylmethionine-8-amino-7-oxononanoate aminotransferase
VTEARQIRGTEAPASLWPYMLPQHLHGADALCSVAAHGVRVRFADGRERLDGSSGLWNVNLGYGNEAVTEAISGSLRDASYLSSWGYENLYARRAAEALIDVAGRERYSRVIFSTSGGAANEIGMKLARHYHTLIGEPNRNLVLGLKGGFHGLTYGAFALTDAKLGHKMYGVDRRLVGHITPNDSVELERVLARLDGRVSAIVVEPVLGTGALPLSDAYINDLLRLRSQYGFLLVVDEVSTGFGRIGNYPFETTRWREGPDLLLTSKALTNGALAASAVLVADAVADVFIDRNAILGHAETQGGTAVVGAAVLAAVGEMLRLGTVERSAVLAKGLDEALADLESKYELVVGSAGRGCMRAVMLGELDGTPLGPEEVGAVVAAVRDAGALVHPGPGSVQLVPALVFTEHDLEELIACLGAGLSAYKRSRWPDGKHHTARSSGRTWAADTPTLR